MKKGNIKSPKEQIAILEKAIASSATPDNIKARMKVKLSELRKKLLFDKHVAPDKVKIKILTNKIGRSTDPKLPTGTTVYGAKVGNVHILPQYKSKKELEERAEKIKSELLAGTYTGGMKIIGDTTAIISPKLIEKFKREAPEKNVKVKPVKKQSVSELISVHADAGKKHQVSIVSELKYRMRLAKTTAADKEKIKDFLSKNGKLKSKVKRKTSDGEEDLSCEELRSRVRQRREASKKSGKKSRTKPVMDKISDHLMHVVKDAINEVPPKEFDKNPNKWFKAVIKISEETKKYLQKLKTLLGKEYDSDKADEIVNEISEFLEEKLQVEKKSLGGIIGIGLGIGLAALIVKAATKHDNHKYRVAYLDDRKYENKFYFHEKSEAQNFFNEAKKEKELSFISLDELIDGSQNDWKELEYSKGKGK